MIDIISESIRREIPESSRICLPYGIELLDLARWMSLNTDGEQKFELIAGSERFSWQGDDVIALFGEIQSRCVNFSLADSLVRSEKNGALYFFDMHERFSFYTADKTSLDAMFPFSREIMWENFALLQQEDEDFSLRQLFDMVHTG